MKSIHIHRDTMQKDDPGTGHNRWYPDLEPIVDVSPGEELLLETRDTADGQIRRGMTVDDLANYDPKVVHPLTGPVFIQGAEPGDLLEVEYLDIIPERYGFTRFRSSMGFLKDLFPYHHLVHWDLAECATSPQVPGVRIRSAPFMGTAGLAPSFAQLEEWTRRERDLYERGGSVLLPDPTSAVPAVEPYARRGLRTAPPRENCGNLDAKQLTKGAHLFIPVAVEGALFSVGDGHYAQGDGEACLTAIETGATAVVRFYVHKGEAARHCIRWPYFSHPGFFIAPEWSVPRNFIATIGTSVRDDGVQEDGDLSLACRNALVNMIELLQRRGYTRDQAYVICSVAVDLRITNLVNSPNVAVSALLSEDIFGN